MKPFWTGFLLSLSLCLDLGIVNLAILRTSLQQGGTAGFLVGLGSCFGDVVYFMLAVAGAAVLVEWKPVRWGLWIVGTCVLLLLAWRMVRETIHPKKIALDGTAAPRESAIKLVATGAGLALASPTGILWFAAVGGSVIASSVSDRNAVWGFGAGFATAALLWSAVFPYAAATLRHFGSHLVRVISVVSALLFLYFAISVFVEGARTLVWAG